MDAFKLFGRGTVSVATGLILRAVAHAQLATGLGILANGGDVQVATDRRTICGHPSAARTSTQTNSTAGRGGL